MSEVLNDLAGMHLPPTAPGSQSGQPANEAVFGSMAFRDLVKDSAASEAIVAAFNTSCGQTLAAPIKALSSGCLPDTVAEHEKRVIKQFIRFVHEQFWINECTWMKGMRERS